MLERLLRRGGGSLSREQEALLADHVGRGDAYVGELTSDVSRAEQARWDALAADSERWTPINPWKTEAGVRLLAEPPEVAVSV